MLCLLLSTLRPTSGMASTSPAYTFPQSQSLPPYFNKNDGNQSEQSGPPEELGQKRSTALKGWRIGLENAHSGHEEDLLGVPEVLMLCQGDSLPVKSSKSCTMSYFAHAMMYPMLIVFMCTSDLICFCCTNWG